MSIESKTSELEQDMESSPPQEKAPVNDTTTEKKSPKKKVAAKKKTNGAAAKKEIDPNQTTLKQLCKDLKIEPRDARRKLRDAGMKADGRWAWKTGSGDLKKVEKALTATAE